MASPRDGMNASAAQRAAASRQRAAAMAAAAESAGNAAMAAAAGKAAFNYIPYEIGAEEGKKWKK